MIVKKSMENSKDDLTAIVSSITSKHIQRITIGFVNPVNGSQLRRAIILRTCARLDDAITRLAEQTLNYGQKLQLELHVCGHPPMDLFDSLFPRFVEIGCLSVFKTSYIWTGSILHPLSFSKRSTQFQLALISGPSVRRRNRVQQVL